MNNWLWFHRLRRIFIIRVAIQITILFSRIQQIFKFWLFYLVLFFFLRSQTHAVAYLPIFLRFFDVHFDDNEIP
eukprot:UN04330